MAKKKVEKVKKVKEEREQCEDCNNPDCQPKTRTINGKCLYE